MNLSVLQLKVSFKHAQPVNVEPTLPDKTLRMCTLTHVFCLAVFCDRQKMHLVSMCNYIKRLRIYLDRHPNRSKREHL